MNRHAHIFWTMILVLIAGAGWFFFGSEEKTGEVFRNTGIIAKTDAAEQVPVGEGESVQAVSSDEKEYRHAILGFSFSYPKEYAISSFGNYFDSAGQTVLLQKDDGSGMQVLITPFDEDVSLTTSRIKKDIPNLDMSDAKEMLLGRGDRKIQAVVFQSTNNLSTGKSFEAWFVYNRNLYQISSGGDSGDSFDIMTSTWKFE